MMKCFIMQHKSVGLQFLVSRTFRIQWRAMGVFECIPLQAADQIGCAFKCRQARYLYSLIEIMSATWYWVSKSRQQLGSEPNTLRHYILQITPGSATFRHVHVIITNQTLHSNLFLLPNEIKETRTTHDGELDARKQPLTRLPTAINTDSRSAWMEGDPSPSGKEQSKSH